MSLSTLLAKANHALAAKNISSFQSQLILFFSLSDGESRAEVILGKGRDFRQAWQDGSRKCQKIANQKKVNIISLRVDWVNSAQTTTWEVLSSVLSKIKRNYFRFGISLDEQFKYAFIEPELNANAMLYLGADKAEAGINHKNFTVYTRRKFGETPILDFSADALVWVFSHEGAFFTEASILDKFPGDDQFDVQWLPGPADTNLNWRDPSCLNSGRRQIKELQAEDVFKLISSSSGFLAKQVTSGGKFIYGHFPCFGRNVSAYNALRHASSVYSMLEAWELTRDADLLAAIQRALIYLDGSLIRRYPQGNGSVLAFNVDANDEIKLGANAVALLALVKYDELVNDSRYRLLMEQLAMGIASMQDAGSGKFIHVLEADDLSVKNHFRIIYYDGEAAFGLMRLYGLTRDPRWLDIVEKAFEYFIAADHWKHHDHWLSYCVNEIAIYKPEEKYFLFGVKNIADYLDFILERETTYPTLLELSMAFEAMLLRIENNHPTMRHVLDGLDIEKFNLALNHRAHFLLNGFFWPELAMYYANPASITGSFFIRHHSFRVRIDDVEHYLSGYVAYWKMLYRSTDPENENPLHRAINYPICLEGMKNGRINNNVLHPIRMGFLLKPAALFWNLMCSAAAKDGVMLSPLGAAYRSYSYQNNLFYRRYEESPEEWPDSINWDGKYWRLKENMNPVPVPGEGNYGWGLSVDVRFDPYGITKSWLDDNGEYFGFCTEDISKPWCLTYFAGDNNPPIWTSSYLEKAAPGEWLCSPVGSLSASGVAFNKATYDPGNIVLMLGKQGDIDFSLLEKIPSVPELIITESKKSDLPSDVLKASLPVYHVDDADSALYKMAHFMRNRSAAKFIAITGSAGKTTTKNMMGHVFSHVFDNVFYSKQSDNTVRAVCRNLASVPQQTDVSIIEICSHAMSRSTGLVRADVAVITNIGAAHLKDLGTLDNIARRKSEIFYGVPKGGSAVICLDTEYADLLISVAKLQGIRILTYGTHPDAHVRFISHDSEQGVTIHTPNGDFSFDLQAEGMHMVRNAMACIATAIALNIELNSIRSGFSSFKAISGRGSLHCLSWGGGEVVAMDESYNANPVSMSASIEAAFGYFKKNNFNRFLMILGDMLELGVDEIKYHEVLAPVVLKNPPDLVILYGERISHLSPILEEKNISVIKICSMDALISWAFSYLSPGDFLLIKGSHGTGLHKLVQQLESR